MASLWTEKYRTRRLNDVIEHDDIIAMIDTSMCSSANEMPHMLFHGRSGTGKTTIALAVCAKLFWHPDKDVRRRVWGDRVLQLNASDDRGIHVVRKYIKTFASASVHPHANMPSFKVIVLDEADAMTNDSQAALRRIMEQYSANTRFILICNYVGKIIEPLISRCVKYKFMPISLSGALCMIDRICDREGVRIDREAAQELHRHSKGDMRKMINWLQRASYVSRHVTADVLMYVCGGLPRHLIDGLCHAIAAPEQDAAAMLECVRRVCRESHCCNMVLTALADRMLDWDAPDDRKADAMLRIARANHLVVTGSDSQIQLTTVCLALQSLLRGGSVSPPSCKYVIC